MTNDKCRTLARGRDLAGDGERGEWAVAVVARKRSRVRDAVYDLKAVNPNAKSNEDTRTPAELLDFIEAKGREVAEALARLRLG